MMEIENAKITATALGWDAHAIFTFNLTLSGSGWGVNFGGYTLDTYDTDKEKRVVVGKCMEVIPRILEVVGVDRWEDLEGKYIRVCRGSLGTPVTKIGNLMKDEWLDLEEFYADIRKKLGEDE